LSFNAEFTSAKSNRFACLENCGMCCYQKGLLLTEYDSEKLKHVSGLKVEVRPTVASGFHWEMRLDNDECPFLKDSRCSVYDDRPTIVEYIRLA
jgi:Fe-S-cluster containining protein